MQISGAREYSWGKGKEASVVKPSETGAGKKDRKSETHQRPDNVGPCRPW